MEWSEIRYRFLLRSLRSLRGLGSANPTMGTAMRKTDNRSDMPTGMRYSIYWIRDRNPAYMGGPITAKMGGSLG